MINTWMPAKFKIDTNKNKSPLLALHHSPDSDALYEVNFIGISQFHRKAPIKAVSPERVIALFSSEESHFLVAVLLNIV